VAGRLDQIPMRWPRLCKIAHRSAIKKGRTLARLPPVVIGRAAPVHLAVMDMWKPFRKSTNKKASQAAAILFDKFRMGDALDKVRKQEYAKLDGKNASSSMARSMRSFPTRRTCRVALEMQLG
jgi:hypothetical protein